MPAPVRLRGVTVETERLSADRRTLPIEPQIVMRVQVGAEAKFRIIELSEDEAIALATDTLTAVRRARERRAARKARP